MVGNKPTASAVYQTGYSGAGHMRRTSGFTLIELLTVIAIIALLAAITFPVYNRTRDAAYRNSDISSMNTLRTALQLYRVDQGGFPPALLGYVNPYQTNGGTPIPADQIVGFLYPRRVASLDTFRPSLLRVGNLEITAAVYPNQDPRPIGSAPLLDLNGDGVVNAADDTAGARQAFGPGDGWVCLNGMVGCDAAGGNQAQFYRVSGYDVATVRLPGGGERVELRYALFWSNHALIGNGHAQDDPRQLGYSDPPETAVITWNSHFRDYDALGQPARTRREIVLFLGGGARNVDSRDVSERSWRVTP